MRQKSKGNLLQLPAGPVDDALAQFVSANKEGSNLLESPALRVGVAYSGGADSTSLLISAIRRWPEQQVHALHVHHGLQTAADDFLHHCQQSCEQWSVPLSVKHVDARHASGESPEDAARNSRYQALIEMAQQQKLDVVLLGQHADDQVETLLLALSRGAGLPGLACMSDFFRKDHVFFVRPILGVGVQALKSYLKEQGISWVEDPTNKDRVYTRNQIRLDILPAIAATFPSYKETFLRSIRHIAQAQQLLEELAQHDMEQTGTPPGIMRLQCLSQERQANVLRFWLKSKENTSPSTRQLEELLKQIQACSTRGHHIHLRVGNGIVERQKEHLHFTKLDKD